MFNIGDIVQWKDEEGHVGIIIGFDGEMIACKMESPFPFGHNCSGRFGNLYNLGYWAYEENLILLERDSSSKEDKICRKAKNLWNKSQWVKKNPQFAY